METETTTRPRDLPDAGFLAWCQARAAEGISLRHTTHLSGYGGTGGALQVRLYGICSRAGIAPPAFSTSNDSARNPRGWVKVTRNNKWSEKITLGRTYLSRVEWKAGDRISVQIENGAIILRRKEAEPDA